MQLQKNTFKSDLLTVKPYTLIDFGAPWCHLCVMLKPVLNRLSAEWRDAIEVVSVDVEQQWQLARQYGVQSLPTLLLLSPEGTVMERLSHFRTREDLLVRCDRLIQTHLHEF